MTNKILVRNNLSYIVGNLHNSNKGIRLELRAEVDRTALLRYLLDLIVHLEFLVVFCSSEKLLN